MSHPKSIERQIAEGDPSKRGKHKLREKLDAQPKCESGFPPRPQHLKGRARWAWNLWTRQLAIMKIDRVPDMAALIGACDAYAMAVKANAMVEEEGITIQEMALDRNGTPVLLKVKKHPAVDVANRSWMVVLGFCREFGFTPAARLKLISNKEPNTGSADELVRMLNAPREKRSPIPGVKLDNMDDSRPSGRVQ